MLRELSIALHEKISEQIERTAHLIEAVPTNALEWAPPINRSWTTAQVLEHIVSCLAGFCAALHAAEPVRLANFVTLRELLPARGSDEVREKFGIFAQHVDTGFECIDDRMLGQVIPTVFVPRGEPLITLLLGNLEHLTNHKHQLFTYLRWLGVDVSSRDLYRFRV